MRVFNIHKAALSKILKGLSYFNWYFQFTPEVTEIFILHYRNCNSAKSCLYRFSNFLGTMLERFGPCIKKN